MANQEGSNVVRGLGRLGRFGMEASKFVYGLVFDPQFNQVEPNSELSENIKIPGGRFLIAVICMIPTSFAKSLQTDIKPGLGLNIPDVAFALLLAFMIENVLDMGLTVIATIGAKSDDK